MTSNIHVSLRLPIELVARIERYGRELGLSKSEAYRAALMRGLENHERAKLDSVLLQRVTAAAAMLEGLLSDKQGDLVRKANAEADSVVRETLGAN